MTTVNFLSFKTKRFFFLPMKKEIKFNFNLESATFSLLFWTAFVASLELSVFKILLDMTPIDVVWARLIGIPFNFLIGGYYQGIYDSFNSGFGISPKVSKYGAIGIIKLGVNVFIYSSKFFTGHSLVLSVVLIKASIVVFAGVLVTSWFTKGYRSYLYNILMRQRKKADRNRNLIQQEIIN